MLRSSEIKPAFTVGGGINRVLLQGGEEEKGDSWMDESEGTKLLLGHVMS